VWRQSERHLAGQEQGRAHQLLAEIIQRKDGQRQIGLCDDADVAVSK
jgi:hypothetical protein